VQAGEQSILSTIDIHRRTFTMKHFFGRGKPSGTAAGSGGQGGGGADAALPQPAAAGADGRDFATVIPVTVIQLTNSRFLNPKPKPYTLNVRN